MKITERRLRQIIRSVIKESHKLKEARTADSLAILATPFVLALPIAIGYQVIEKAIEMIQEALEPISQLEAGFINLEIPTGEPLIIELAQDGTLFIRLKDDVKRKAPVLAVHTSDLMGLEIDQKTQFLVAILNLYENRLDGNIEMVREILDYKWFRTVKKSSRLHEDTLEGLSTFLWHLAEEIGATELSTVSLDRWKNEPGAIGGNLDVNQRLSTHGHTVSDRPHNTRRRRSSYPALDPDVQNWIDDHNDASGRGAWWKKIKR